MNRHVSYAEFTKDPAKHMVEARTTTVYIDDSGVVMMSKDEYEGWKETAHLLSSPGNAKRLFESIASANAGKLEKHETAE